MHAMARASIRAVAAPQNVAINVDDARSPHIGHGAPQFVLENRQRLGRAGLAARANALERRAAGQREFGAEREAFDEVAAAAHA